MAKRRKFADQPDLFPVPRTHVIYCGDNLARLAKLDSESADLIYIDPPFNSNRNYEVFWGEKKEKRHFDDRHASTQAYIEYMRPRCMALSRVLKCTGSFYYHCDWHASHYVKEMLDQILGESNFQNEIVWQRTNSRTEPAQWPRLHDVLLFYTGGGKSHCFNPIFVPGDKSRIPHTLVKVPDGKKYNTSDLTGGGLTAEGESGRPWRGYNPADFGRHWGYSHSQLNEWDKAGLIHWPKKKGKAGGFPRKRDEKPFVPAERMVQVGSVWTDIDRLNQTAKERIGYPTQKPVALLERIIQASSNPGDLVLDAFCGCGTALVAAEKLDREWIGIDISPTACEVMADRLRRDCGLVEGTDFLIRDLPRSIKQLREMPHREFEKWAVIALKGIPNKTQVRDMGIDGRLYLVSDIPKRKKGEQLHFMDQWYPIQVKQKDKVGRPDIDGFEAVMMRVKQDRGYFVGFDFTSDAEREIVEFKRRTGKRIVTMTVQEILDEEHEMKLV